MMKAINADEFIQLELVNETHAEPLFNLVIANRNELSEWLPWVSNVKSVDFLINFINGSKSRNAKGIEFAYVIYYQDKIAGRIGVYDIDEWNKKGSIGYWLGADFQGMGIVTKSCEALINFCFNNLNLNRLEIKCGTENKKSQFIPERLGFVKEGIARQAELHGNKFIDLNIYSMLKDEWIPVFNV